MTTIHTITLPDGRTAKRTSQNRVYSHVVVGRRRYDYDLAQADRLTATDRANFAHYWEFIQGTSRFLQRNSWEKDDAKFAERVAKDIARAKKAIGAAESPADYAEDKRAQRVAEVKQKAADGYYDAWGALTWASRRDLAEKQLNSWPGYETRVLEVTDRRVPQPRGAR